MPDDSNDPLLETLRQLPRELPPPAALEDATVRRLRVAGALRSSFPVSRWLAAAALAIAFLGTGYWTGQRSVPAVPDPTYALLLYGGSTGDDSAAHAVRAAEYSSWAATPHATAAVVGGEALAGNGMLIFAPDTGAFGGIAAAVLGADETQPVGFFLVRAASRQAAMQLARDCPHLKYGGRIVVREILPT